MDKILLLDILWMVVAVDAVFDCGRPSGQDLCLVGSTCDLANGQCVCPDVRSGYNCGLVLAFQDASPCDSSPACSNEGTCLGNGTTASCHCTEDFVGDTCETPRYTRSCGDGEMTISVTPFGDFSEGVMYVEGDPDCTLEPETPGTPGGRYSRTLPHTGGTCIDALALGDNRYSRRLVILYNNLRITGRDEVITVNCGGDLITTTFNVTVGELNQDIHKETLGIVPQNADINFHLTVDGNNITSGLSLGDDVTVSFSLTDQGKQKFTAYRVESCLATNNLPSNDSEYMSAAFITDSCHAADLASVTIQPIQTNAAIESVTFVFEAFRFRNGPTDKLAVQCVVKMCLDEQGCQPVVCPGDPSDSPGGLGRRRRRRRDAGEEYSLTRVLTIESPLSGTAQDTIIKEQDCTTTGVDIGVVIGMATVIFFLLVLVITLILRECHNRKFIELDAVSQSSTCRLASRQTQNVI